MASGGGEHFLRQLSASGNGSSSYYAATSQYQLPPRGGEEEEEDGGGGGVGRRRGSRRWSSRKRGKGGARGASAAAAVAVVAGRKRVMVVVDDTSGAKHAMMWALTHVANKGDFLTLLHVLPPHAGGDEATPSLANSLGMLCKACRPEVEVEALVIQGPKLATVLSQVKKLEASVLVLSQCKPSHICWLSCFLRSSSEDFVEQCINQAECLTLAVRKQSKGVGGYLISTRWQKNFWLLA
uniref:UspA domain-containing protein n=1 Tax=Leersia perrieri TaxID=77586 RepID=A0A0D9V8G7_9ORYZ